MDPILAVLLSWQFVLFGLAIATVMYVLRIVVEYVATLVKKSLANSQLWNDLLLPILPVIIGALSSYFFKVFPYPGFPPGPGGVIPTGDRIIFGLVAGLLSGLMYRVIKSLLYQKIAGLAQGLQGVVGQPGVPAPPVIVPAEQLPPRGSL